MSRFSLSSSLPIPDQAWSPRTERLAVVAFWGVVAALALLQRWVNPFRPGATLPEVLFGLDPVALANIGIYAAWALLTLPIFRLAHGLPLRHPAWRRRLLMHFGIALGVTITLEGIKYAVIAVLLSASELPTLPGASAPSFGPSPSSSGSGSSMSS